MTERPKNGFLRSLSDHSFALLAEHLTPVAVVLSAQLQAEDDPVEWVYFPENSLLSMISNGPGDDEVETSMVGSEGAAGLMEACGSGMSSVSWLVQVDGRAWRAPAAWCRKLALNEPDFAARAWRSTELQIIEARQSALCQTLHPVEHRFARWMLESLERSGGRNPLPMTQEFLADMLGVQRTTITAFASKLQASGMIRYRRGSMTILDPASLERLSCGCRGVLRTQRARLGLKAPAAEVAPA